jgi:DNA mismatch repair protein MutS
MTSKPRVRNFNIAIREWNDQIIFLRKLVSGGTSRSYGIQVARIAGLPEEVLARAREILENLEQEQTDEMGRPRIAVSRKVEGDASVSQLALFGGQDHRLRKWIRELDISTMSPLEALIELNKLKEYTEDDDS